LGTTVNGRFASRFPKIFTNPQGHAAQFSVGIIHCQSLFHSRAPAVSEGAERGLQGAAVADLAARSVFRDDLPQSEIPAG
jgi:hypothetical protein